MRVPRIGEASPSPKKKSWPVKTLFHKNKVHGKYQTDTSSQVIPLESHPFEEKDRKNNKNDQGDYFLNNFQLHQRKRSPVTDESQAISRHLRTVLK